MYLIIKIEAKARAYWFDLAQLVAGAASLW
jgi:hypothetical protein